MTQLKLKRFYWNNLTAWWLDFEVPLYYSKSLLRNKLALDPSAFKTHTKNKLPVTARESVFVPQHNGGHSAAKDRVTHWMWQSCNVWKRHFRAKQRPPGPQSKALFTTHLRWPVLKRQPREIMNETVQASHTTAFFVFLRMWSMSSPPIWYASVMRGEICLTSENKRVM